MIREPFPLPMNDESLACRIYITPGITLLTDDSLSNHHTHYINAQHGQIIKLPNHKCSEDWARLKNQPGHFQEYSQKGSTNAPAKAFKLQRSKALLMHLLVHNAQVTLW